MTTLLRIAYTAPNSPELGQQTVTVVLGGSSPNIEAVCQTEVSIDHPPGQKLRLVSPSLRTEDTEPQLVVQLPDAEQQLELACVAVPSQAAIKITITTKKEGSKPDPVRRASFQR